MAPKPGPRPDAAEAIALMRQGRTRGRGRRSPVMVWMQENRVTLEAAFAQTAPAWGILAAYLGERGVTDGDGKPPTARSARETWGRVIAAAKTAADHGTQDPASGSLPSTATPAVAAGQAVPPSPDSNEAELPRRTFGLATPRGMDPAVKTPHAPSAHAETPTPAAPAVDVDDVLARFSGKPGPARE